LAKQLHLYEWIEEEELVGAVFRGSTVILEGVLDFTNGFMHGAAPKPPI
jgi:hypothetical protein